MKIKEYFLPKSYVYTGDHQNVETIIRHYHYDQTTLKMSNTFKPIEGYKDYIQVIGLSDVDKIKALKTYFAVDALTLEDVFNVTQRNKIETKNTYLFGVFDVNYLEDNHIKKDYMSVLLFENTLISFHEKEPVFLGPLHDVISEYAEIKQRGVDYLFFHILDIITDDQLDVLDVLRAQASVLETDILESKKVNQEAFYTLRKHLLQVKNSVGPTLEQFSMVLAKNIPLLKQENKGFFDDLLDHLKRLDAQLNESRELMRYLLDLHINNQSNTMNRIMTTLTLFSAIFIPLSFLTGFFGMNFVHFSLLEYKYALVIFIALCFVLAGFMVALFKKMKWF